MKAGYRLKYWATAALNLSLFSIFLMCRRMECQSMTVLGINEYFRQFLFVAIWISWLCLDEWRTGRRIVCVGMARRPDRAWCKMKTLLTFLLSSNDSHSSSFSFLWPCSHVYSCLLRNEHPCVKMIVPTLNITPNTWLSLTKEGVPTGPTRVFRSPLYFITIMSKFLTGAIFKCHPHGYPSFDIKNK